MHVYSPSAPADLDSPHPTRDRIPTSVALGEVEVALVRWPEEASLRHALAALGRPRLLLVEPGSTPPDPLDGPEDWLRWPPDPAELLLRAQHLRQRTVVVDDRPLELDDDGVLRRGDRWAAVSEPQVPVLRLLLDNLDRVVRFDTIAAAYVAGGGSGHAASVRTMLSRIEAKIRPLGLELRSVRRRGIVLHSATGRYSAGGSPARQ